VEVHQLYQIYLQYPRVQTDTRKIAAGEMFFALKGDNFNGNAFAQQALQLGAAYVVVDEPQYVINDKCILVFDVLGTLQALATYHRQQLQIPVLAITGSNGKTTTKELINAVLSTQYSTSCTIGNLNNHIGVPLTLLSIPLTAQIAIVEMGANHQQEIKTYCQWALPTHVLINNVGKAHLEGFGGLEGVRKGKGELYDFAAEHKCIVLSNTDLTYLADMQQERNITHSITYGRQQAQYTGMPIDNNGLLSVGILTPGMETTIDTQLVGDYNFANVMAAVAVGSTFNIGIDTIKQAIQEYTPSNSRSQLIKLGTNTIILDAYNANPTSMKGAIENFARTTYPNKYLMLGGMWELGADSIAEHQHIVDLIEHYNFNNVVLVGGHFKDVYHQFIYFDNSLQAAQWLQQQQLSNAAILIKGSRASAMEKVLG
jgi:UDP-N-acetylmuramoyl-tripeptide--D-alanyl-D-alanine ligase